MTGIEYIINPDGSPGEAFNPYSGCLHTLKECATVDRCWARAIAKRFKQTCGGDFQPRFHPERLNEPFRWRKPRRVAVCFMGDLFGDWMGAEAPSGHPPLFPMDWIREFILEKVRQYPQHTFLFLTKAPQNLAEWNPWPDNAWVGASAWDTDSFCDAATALRKVKASIKWISLEPLLGPVNSAEFFHLKEEEDTPKWWLVVGAQTGSGAVKPRLEWIEEIIKSCRNAGVPYWLKNNLISLMGEHLAQNLPIIKGVDLVR